MIVQVYPNTHLKFILGLLLLCMLNMATTHLGFGLRKLIIGLNDFEWKGVKLCYSFDVYLKNFTNK